MASRAWASDGSPAPRRHPLAIELAAARTRTLSISQILDSLRSSFRLLTGGARTAVRRQQTLSASIDWSYSLLTETERILLRRLAVFAAGFDLDAAHVVGADTDCERAQLIDILGLLVDKSLVIAEDARQGMRYRLLETVRQYSLEKLAASGEADTVRARHCSYCVDTATRMWIEMRGDGTPLVPWAEAEMDNLRAAFAWSCENTDFTTALSMVSMLQRLWVIRGRYWEGLAGFDAVFGDERFRRIDVPPEVWAFAAANEAVLARWHDLPANADRVEEALAIARGVGDDRLTARTLMASGFASLNNPQIAGPYFTEAVALARAGGGQAELYEGLAFLCYFLNNCAGLPEQSEAAGEEGWRLADRFGDRFVSRYCRSFLSTCLGLRGRFAEAIALGQRVIDEARLDADLAMEGFGLTAVSISRVFIGDADGAYEAATAVINLTLDVGGIQPFNHAVLARVAPHRGDSARARRECRAAVTAAHPPGEIRNNALLRSMIPMAQAAMGCGDLPAARRWADDVAAEARGAHRVMALAARARVAIAQRETTQAECDVYEALAASATSGGLVSVPDALECLATLADGEPQRAARLLGAANGTRQLIQEVRCPLFDSDHAQTITHLREALGESAFVNLCSEG